MTKPPDRQTRPLDGELDPLVERVAARLRNQVPWYQLQEPYALREMVRQDCVALGEALATNELPPLRRYVEAMGRVRLQAGAPATSLIAGISLLEEELRLLLTATAPDPAAVSERTRRLQNLIRNMRMILSGVNLQLLTEATRPPARPDPPHAML